MTNYKNIIKVISMNENLCKNCQYFVQHYVLGPQKLVSVNCGQCIYGRTKRKQAYSTACENFIPGQPSGDGFVSREYLSKALLQRVLDMELLPEIEDKR